MGSDYYRLRRYGLTQERYDELWQKQGGKCGVCQKAFESIVYEGPKRSRTPINVDHCHTTGVVRGLVCSKCNFGLGYLDNFDWTENAIRYLTNK